MRKKVNQRLGVLRRIKYFIPFYARKLFVNTMILSFLDYYDIVWGDRNSKLLMDSLQVLQNRATKIVLDRPVYSSTTEALLDLKWKELRVRLRIHRLIYVFKCLNGLLDHNYNLTTNASVHNYQTRHANDLRINRSRCGKGQLLSSCFLWNEIPLDIRSSKSVGIFYVITIE